MNLPWLEFGWTLKLSSVISIELIKQSADGVSGKSSAVPFVALAFDGNESQAADLPGSDRIPALHETMDG